MKKKQLEELQKQRELEVFQKIHSIKAQFLNANIDTKDIAIKITIDEYNAISGNLARSPLQVGCVAGQCFGIDIVVVQNG